MRGDEIAECVGIYEVCSVGLGGIVGEGLVSLEELHIVGELLLLGEGRAHERLLPFHAILINQFILCYNSMILQQYHAVRGLKYLPNFLTHPEKQAALQLINSRPWCHRLARAQQYYGIKYFQTKIQDQVLQPATSHDHYPLSSLQFLIDRAIQHSLFSPQNPPNQILVNRYYRSDKLGLHVEDTSAFGDVIVGISLGSTDYLRLVHTQRPEQSYLLPLQDRSCYMLSGEARYEYRHGIGRVINNSRYKEEGFERISLTLRHVIDSRRKLGAGSQVPH